MKRYKKWAQIAWVWMGAFVAAVLAYKVHVANDLSDTVAGEPMELWIATALVFILLDRVVVDK